MRETAGDPSLSDWVRACEVSKLWPMTMSASDDGWVLFWGDAFASGLCGAFVTFDDSGGHVVTRIGFNETVHATPAELTAVLDRLAEEASRE